MIIVKFHGGLGNQMYQYVFYLYLKKRWPNIAIKADLEGYRYEPHMVHNGFELEDVFANIDLESASVSDILSAGGEYERQRAGVCDIIRKRLYNMIRNKENVVYEENWEYFANNTTEDNLNYQTYWLCGFWANISTGIAETTFSFLRHLDPKNQEILYKLENVESVSIHVRRGDYVGTSLEQCSMDYYVRAIHYLENKFTNLEWFVFSDDKEYIKDKFCFLTECTIVDWNYGKDNYKDMELMSHCKHNIIANSTFSAWGAILNTNVNKIVVLPRGYRKGIPADVMGDWIEI